MNLTEFIISSTGFINLAFLFLFIVYAWKLGYISRGSLYLKLITTGVIIFIVVILLSVIDIFLNSSSVRNISFILSLIAVFSMTAGVVIRGSISKRYI
jgi:hypothetical protein